MWNLIPSNTDGESESHSREYLFIHLIDYAETADENIASDGGQTYEQMYFMWPVGLYGNDFDPATLSNSQISMGLFDRETLMLKEKNDWVYVEGKREKTANEDEISYDTLITIVKSVTSTELISTYDGEDWELKKVD